MVRQVECETKKYKKSYNKAVRKEKGQFFTSAETARYMATMVASRQRVSILDAGAGNGILSCALIEHFSEIYCNEINLVLCENDPNILPLLSSTVKLIDDYCHDRKINFTCRLITDNFIELPTDEKFDIIISNPPYKKVSKQSPEAQAMLDYVYGQPNLYGLFMCKAVELLNDDGEFLFITPRSWTSGEYFEKIRTFLTKNIGFEKFHLFISREDSFSNEAVLQETMISYGKKSRKISNILISTSTTDSFLDLQTFTVPKSSCIGITSKNYVLIPSSPSDVANLIEVLKYNNTLSGLGYKFKTGPVVEFRSEKSLRFQSSEDCIPMIRAQHIKNGQFIFPDPSTEKAQYFSTEKTCMKLQNRVTVFLKRVTAKEENRRLQACVYSPKFFKGEYITAENHVNYLVKTNGDEISLQEADDICRILNSNGADTYFRMLSGSTQINASEINDLPIKMEALCNSTRCLSNLTN